MVLEVGMYFRWNPQGRNDLNLAPKGQIVAILDGKVCIDWINRPDDEQWYTAYTIQEFLGSIEESSPLAKVLYGN